MRKRSWASALLAAALLAACGGGEGDGGEPTLSVYVSLPLRGDDGRDAADGARMALAEAGGEAAGIPVAASFLDDAPGGGRGWTPVQVAANAREAIQDSTAIAYLGDFESGATRTSLPITNAAGMLQVSPASGAGDLVAPAPGSEELPDAQPGGTRTFGRVIPSDRAQAAAGAGWAARLRFPSVATRSDGSGFGDAMVAGFEDALSGPDLVRDPAALVYYAGEPASRPPSPSGDRQALMVTDAELVPEVAAEPDGTLATAAALYPGQLPAAGRRFAREFAAEYGRPAGPYAAYGYEAMAVILDSIERASEPTDRTAVIDAFFATSERDSVLGPYSIDEVGDTTLDRVSGYRYRAGVPRPREAIAAGP